MSRDAADFFRRAGLVSTLPVRLKARSEPYYFVTPADRALQPTVELLRNELLTLKEEALAGDLGNGAYAAALALGPTPAE